MSKYPRRRRNPHNSWWRCGWCNAAFRGQKRYLAHKCEIVDLPRLMRADGITPEMALRLKDLVLPTDFVFKSTSTLISEAKTQAIRAKK